jgi:RimJ/RimL family protein N-acetyltransferase
MHLETERLIIREYIIEDVIDEYEYNKDQELFKYMPFRPRTYYETRKWIEQIIESQNETPRNRYNLAVVLKSTQELVGGFRISIESDIEGSIGYKFGKAYWGKGYATEAAFAVIGFGFDMLRFHRVYASVHPENVASIRVLEKIGMTLEGRLRENLLNDGVYGDSLIYSILEQEWKTQQSMVHTKTKSISI